MFDYDDVTPARCTVETRDGGFAYLHEDTGVCSSFFRILDEAPIACERDVHGVECGTRVHQTRPSHVDPTWTLGTIIGARGGMGVAWRAKTVTVEVTSTLHGVRRSRSLTVEWDGRIERDFIPADGDRPAQHRIFVRDTTNRFEREIGVRLAPLLVTRIEAAA